MVKYTYKSSLSRLSHVLITLSYAPWFVNSFLPQNIQHLNNHFTQSIERRVDPISRVLLAYPRDNNSLPNKNSGKIQEYNFKNKKKDHSRTLYDILGASPSDTHDELRARYTKLAKALHPDSRNQNTQDFIVTFTEVNEAWKILSDPKERKKYDRQIRVKQIGNMVGNMIDLGIKTAIPIVKKTAFTTLNIVDNSSKTMKEVGDQMNKDVLSATNKFAVDSKSRDLERQANKERNKANHLLSKLKNLQGNPQSIIQSSATNLSSNQAYKMLNNFQSKDKSLRPEPDYIEQAIGMDNSIEKEIHLLNNMESSFQQTLKDHQNQEKEINSVSTSLKKAINSEALALQRVEDAKRDLANAQSYINECKRNQSDAIFKEKKAANEVKKVNGLLNLQKERVRAGLRQREEKSFQLQSYYLREESYRLEQSVVELESEAERLRKRSDELKGP